MKVAINGNGTDYKNPFERLDEKQDRRHDEIVEKLDQIIKLQDELRNEKKKILEKKVSDSMVFWIFPSKDSLHAMYREVERRFKYKLVYTSKQYMNHKVRPYGFRTVWGLNLIFIDSKNKDETELMKSVPNVPRFKYSEDADSFECLIKLFYTGKKG
jgi:hypothetical protein